MSLSQILALSIFLAMFIVIIMGKWHRYISALAGAALTIVFVFLIAMQSPEAMWKVLNLSQMGTQDFWVPSGMHIASYGVNWQTIIFIGGMMIMVEGLNDVGFFRWLCLFTAKLVHYKVVPLLIVFMLLSGILSMFIDSITVLLFLASVTIELGRLLKFDPVPVIIAEICAANTGGSATMCGDPPNIIIGTAFGFTFQDFIINTGPIAAACLLLTIVFFYFSARRALSSPKSSEEANTTKYPEPGEAIVNLPIFILQSIVFLLIVILLITHAQTGISVALIGVIAAVLTLVVAIKDARHIIKRVDWRTLVFFVGLFICVGGLEETGVLKLMADSIGHISGGSLVGIISIILWSSAFFSAIVDNIPFAATMVPVISNLSHTMGINLGTLSWTLALGTDIGGNATPIGASANVVGTAIAEREGYPIGWGRFLRYALPAMILAVALIHLLLLLRYA